VADRGDDRPTDAVAFAARRAQEYAERWSDIWTRLTTTEYRSEHLLDDAFSMYGMWVKDATAAGAWMARAWGADRRAPGEHPHDEH
jgi:hypothetical protein